ncbi:MAG: FRG domain-containing protein [Caulobacterales bacterium]
MDSKHFSSWSDFKDGYAHFLPGPRGVSFVYSKILFRGQMDASWPLMSSFDRAIPDASLDRRREYAKWLNFCRSLYRKLGMPVDAMDEFELSALAQHYGVSTRMLDWSMSPYIAAFFAFCDSLIFRQPETNDIAVWAIDVLEFERHAKRDFYIASPKSFQNARVRNQLGKFLVNSTTYATLEEYIGLTKPAAGAALRKLTIPASERIVALNDLLLMGISPVDIYPDLEGVARYVRLRQLLDGYR